ncbi:histidine kinase dimerization/phosphoacceptor domain-containing protein [Streptomyces tunisiensis]|uniref:histidine kinase dimerization/phosphoacceptor domain-containing protein n=1 Tax=Streptomyces tunisiensis TaxID=948699 RepID=UPI0039894A76
MDKGRFAVPAGITAWATALGVAALMLGTGLSGPHPSGGRELLGAVLLVIGGLAPAAHRRAPLMVLAVTGVCAVGCLAAGFDTLAVSCLVAVYGAVRAGHRTITLGVSVGLVAVLHLTALIFLEGTVGETTAQARNTLELAWLIAAFAAGEAVRQAERRADEAERTREETARRRADEERLRNARELHDSLTHQISVVKVQSEVAVQRPRPRARTCARLPSHSAFVCVPCRPTGPHGGTRHVAGQGAECRAVVVPPSATSTSTSPSTAATRSRGWSTVHRASTPAVFAPGMIAVSSVRVTDAATRTAGRDTCIHVTSRIHGTRLTAPVGKHRLRA